MFMLTRTMLKTIFLISRNCDQSYQCFLVKHSSYDALTLILHCVSFLTFTRRNNGLCNRFNPTNFGGVEFRS